MRPARLIPRKPSHFKNDSLGALYAIRPSPPIVKPVAKKASYIIGNEAILIKGTNPKAVIPKNETQSACFNYGLAK